MHLAAFAFMVIAGTGGICNINLQWVWNFMICFSTTSVSVFPTFLFLRGFDTRTLVESSTMSQELYFMNKFVEKNCRNGELVSFIYLSDQTTCRNNQNKRITWPRFKKYRRLFVCLHSFRNIIELNLISILTLFIQNNFWIHLKRVPNLQSPIIAHLLCV